MLYGAWHLSAPCVPPGSLFPTWSSLVACVPRTQRPCTVGYLAPLGCGHGPVVCTGSSVGELVSLGGFRSVRVRAPSSRPPCSCGGWRVPGCIRHLLVRVSIQGGLHPWTRWLVSMLRCVHRGAPFCHVGQWCGLESSFAGLGQEPRLFLRRLLAAGVGFFNEGQGFLRVWGCRQVRPGSSSRYLSLHHHSFR